MGNSYFCEPGWEWREYFVYIVSTRVFYYLHSVFPVWVLSHVLQILQVLRWRSQDIFRCKKNFAFVGLHCQVFMTFWGLCTEFWNSVIFLYEKYFMRTCFAFWRMISVKPHQLVWLPCEFFSATIVLEQTLTLPTSCISENCIKIKVNLNFHFGTCLWCLKRFYECL